MEYIMTQNEKVMKALTSGKELTAGQLRSQYKIVNPTAVICNLRKAGHKVFTVTRRNTTKYSLKK